MKLALFISALLLCAHAAPAVPAGKALQLQALEAQGKEQAEVRGTAAAGKNPVFRAHKALDSGGNDRTSSKKKEGRSLAARVVANGRRGALTSEENQFMAKRIACPGQCSSHGSCDIRTGVCACSSGWTGSDCSYTLRTLVSGTQVAGQTVDKGAWSFFSISTVAGSGLTVIVNQTSPNADCDLYLNQGAIPSFSQYMYKDISVAQHVGVDVDDAGTGTWYIGVYGYTTTTFSVTATTGSQCPTQNNCNGHGTCVGADVCSCDSGWTGSDCSARLQRVNLNQEISTRVDQSQWLYFQVTVPAGRTLLEFSVRQTTTGDVDMYIKQGNLPKIWDYDYRDVSLNANFNISIAQPAAGSWYVGIYGFQPASFIFVARDESAGCASDCSKHGTCVSTQCICNTGFTGLYCETMTAPLTLSTPWVEGYVDDNTWNHFHTGSLLSSRGVVVLVEQLTTAGSGFTDCDLYVKQGSVPSRFDYDFRDINIAAKFNITISDPGSSAWYIGIYGYSKCHYQVMVREASGSCPQNCGGHGRCLASGECECNAGWAGDDCTHTVTALVNGADAVSGSVGANSWQYYSLKLPTSGTTYFVANVKETSSSGDVWLFATKSPDVPTVRQHEYSDQSTNTAYHAVHVELSSSSTETWIFGVYGSPLIASDGPASQFKIAAWAPPF